MKTGIVMGAYFGTEESLDGLARMKRHGYDCMDYNCLADDLELYGYSNEKFETTLINTREKINSAGIEVSQTHGPWRWPPRDFEESDRKERFEKMSKAITATEILGARNFVIHPIMPFGWDRNPDPERFWDMNCDFLSRLAEVGKACNVTICLENMPMTKLSVSSPYETLRMVKQINSPHMKMCLDTGHSIVLGVQPADAVRYIGKEYLACLHVHDNDGNSDLHDIPFAGVINWQDFSSALNEIGYGGVLSLETDIDHTVRLPNGLKEYFEIGLAKTAKELTKAPNGI